jgi:hypothetical protein
MEETRSSEMSVRTRPTRRHIPEDGILHSRRCKILKFYSLLLIPGHCISFNLPGNPIILVESVYILKINCSATVKYNVHSVGDVSVVVGK